MTDINAREILAKEIVDFMLKYGDTYELRDCYDSVEDFVTETIMALYDAVKRKVMALVLKEYVEWWDITDEEDEIMVAKAAILYQILITL